MSRRAVSKSPQARLDLIDAALFVAEGDPDAADRFLDDIDKTLQRLAKHPLLGRARPELGLDLRSFPRQRYIIFYRPTLRGVHLIRVLHGSRDIPPLLEDP